MGKEKKQNTKSQILHAGKRLYEEKGLLEIKVSDIAKSANVARATFFTHFKNLDDLYFAIGEEEVKHIFEYYNAKGGNNKKEKTVFMLETLIDESLFAKGLFHKVIFQNYQENAPMHKIKEELSALVGEQIGAWILGSLYAEIYISCKTCKDEIIKSLLCHLEKIL